MRPRAGYIGFNRVPNSLVAPGVWTLREAQQSASAWPRRPPYLDEVTSGTLVFVYSVRKAVSSYSGYLMRIRRSSDNATLDVPADYAGVAEWIGGHSVVATKWYDQSGNGYTADFSGGAPDFSVSGDADTNSMPYIGVSSTNYFQATTSTPNRAPFGYVMSAVVAPVGDQSAGTNNISSAIIYYAESGGWGSASMSVLKSSIAGRFGTGVFGNKGPSASRSTASNSICVGTFSKYSSSERLYINGSQQGSTYSNNGNTIANTGSVVQVGGGDYGGPDAKVCEVVFVKGAAAGDDTAIAASQMHSALLQ